MVSPIMITNVCVMGISYNVALRALHYVVDNTSALHLCHGKYLLPNLAFLFAISSGILSLRTIDRNQGHPRGIIYESFARVVCAIRGPFLRWYFGEARGDDGVKDALRAVDDSRPPL